MLASNTTVLPGNDLSSLRLEHTHPTLAGDPKWYQAVLVDAVEISFALVLLLLSLPILLLVALGIKATSRGPILYTQIRLGKNGQPYTLIKFRSMTVDSEKGGACWSLPGDPRVTLLGRFLRRTHLDELPQLWNVLQRDMSLIGPRPERPEFVSSLETRLPRYRQRTAVLPGLTGLAQVQQAADTDLESVRIKLAYDLWYIEHRSLSLDLSIFLATGLLLCGFSFATLRWLFRFPTSDAVQQAYATSLLTAQQPSSPKLAAALPGM